VCRRENVVNPGPGAGGQRVLEVSRLSYNQIVVVQSVKPSNVLLERASL